MLGEANGGVLHGPHRVGGDRIDASLNDDILRRRAPADFFGDARGGEIDARTQFRGELVEVFDSRGIDEYVGKVLGGRDDSTLGVQNHPAPRGEDRLTLLLSLGDGKKVSGTLKPSSELGMHLMLYRERPDILAVVHAHPPTATGFSVAGIPLTPFVLPEVVITLGEIPLAPYGTPGTPEISYQIGRAHL